MSEALILSRYLRRSDAEFSESEHPRAGDGKFTSGGGGYAASKSVKIDIGGAKYTIETKNGKPIKLIGHKDAGRGETEDVVEWTPDMDDPSFGATKVLERARKENPDEFTPPEIPDLSKEKLSELPTGMLVNAKREADEYLDAIYDQAGNDEGKLLEAASKVSAFRKLIREERERREKVKEQASVETRRSQPSATPGSVVSAEPKFGKVDEKDPLWYISPHGAQPILESAREVGYSDLTIRGVLGALKQQGWSGSSESADTASELKKIASGAYGEAEQSLLRAIGEREAHASGVIGREYYRKGSFRGQEVLSTTRDPAGAAMATGVGEFESVGWDEKKTGQDLLDAGYLPFGETFTQGYQEESETLWLKFPAARADAGMMIESGEPDSAKPVCAAGVMFVDEAGRVLLLRRSDTGEWAFPGGHIEPGESAEQAARRECKEEIGHAPGELREWTRRIANGVDFTTFLASVPEAFEPELDHEHIAYSWEKLGDYEGDAIQAVTGRADATEFEENKVIPDSRLDAVSDIFEALTRRLDQSRD